MASSSCSSKTLIITPFLVILLLLFLQSLLIGSCFAIRTRGVSMKEDEVFAMRLSSYSREKHTIEIDRLFFTKLPKDVPIPPSAPSKTHNSTPANRQKFQVSFFFSFKNQMGLCSCYSIHSVAFSYLICFYTCIEIFEYF